MSEKRYALDPQLAISLLTQSKVPCAIVRKDHTFQYINPAWCAALDATVDQVKETKYDVWTLPEDLAEDNKLADAVASGEIPGYSLVKTYLRKGYIGGKPRTIQGRLEVIGHFEQNEFKYYLVWFWPFSDIYPAPGLQTKEVIKWLSENSKFVATLLAIILAALGMTNETTMRFIQRILQIDSSSNGSLDSLSPMELPEPSSMLDSNSINEN